MTISKARPDILAPWHGRLDGPVVPAAVEGGKAFILKTVGAKRKVSKQSLAQAFARFANKPVWEAALSELIHAGAIDLVVDTRSRRVLVIPGTGQPPDPMQAGPDPFGYRGES